MHVRKRRGLQPKTYYLFLLLAIAGGAALNLFSTLSVNRASAQTGAADRIAFTRDGQIFTVNPDGSGLTPLGPGSDPSWSNQGKIAFTYGPGEFTQIAVMDEDGANLVVLSPDEMPTVTSASQPDFSTDGNRIAFVTGVLKTEPGEPAPVVHSRIHVMDANGQNLRPFFSGDADSALDDEYAPAWSADGTKVAFIGQKTVGGVTSVDLYVAHADGQTPPTKVTNFGDSRMTLGQIAWSPDGLRLAFAATQDIYVVNADGSGGLTNLTNTVPGRENIDPAWSPDGQKIAYSVNVDGGTFNGIYVMNADGQQPIYLNTTGFQPTWKKRDVTPSPTPTPTPTPTPDPTPTPAPTPTPTPTPMPRSADLADELTASPVEIEVGQNVTYTVRVKNNGPDAALNAVALFDRPDNVELVLVSPAQGSCEQSANYPSEPSANSVR